MLNNEYLDVSQNKQRNTFLKFVENLSIKNQFFPSVASLTFQINISLSFTNEVIPQNKTSN